MGEPIDWTLRRAGRDDAGALALIGAATFLESYAHLLPGADIVAHCAVRHAPAAYAAWLADAETACWLIESATGAPLGFAVATAPDLPLADLGPHDIELRRIYALGLVQGRGVGRALVEAASGWGRGRGSTRLLLGVYDANLPAIGFYRRLGFDIVGEREFTVGASMFHDWVMALAL